MNVTFIEDAENNINGGQRRCDQKRLVRQRSFEHLSRALQASMNARRHMDLFNRSSYFCRTIAERRTGHEIERYCRCDKETLVIDRERRVARREMSEGGEGNHGLLTCAHRRPGGSALMPCVGKSVRRGIARCIGQI